MPLNILASVRHEVGSFSGAVEVNWVDSKTRVDTARNEPTTAAYALVNLRTAYQWKAWRLSIDIENLLDKGYFLPLGGLSLGDYKASGRTDLRPVAGRGRSVNVGLSRRFWGLVPKGPGRGDATGPLAPQAGRNCGQPAGAWRRAGRGAGLRGEPEQATPEQAGRATGGLHAVRAPPSPHEAPRAARSLRKAPLQAQPVAHAPGLPKVSLLRAQPAPRPLAADRALCSPAIASLPALAPIAPHAPAGEPSKASQKADRAALPADYVHKVWARIMACRPAGITIDGRVTLRFDLDDRGHLASVAVVGPSGVAMLDRAAVVALRRAAPFPCRPRTTQRCRCISRCRSVSARGRGLTRAWPVAG
jgi:TonB family protein